MKAESNTDSNKDNKECDTNTDYKLFDAVLHGHCYGRSVLIRSIHLDSCM
jgi:hypothetical protein